MRTKKRKAGLDEVERQIEDAAGDFRSASKEIVDKVDAALAAARKTRNINIRISESDLDRLRLRSRREGLPYQTLISSILHKYVNDRLVDEEVIRKSLHLLRSENLIESASE
jgi:predicted DNA binding CopG/RHH family protein